MLLYLGSAAFISGVIGVLTLHIGVSLLVGTLGEERFISPGSVNGCNSWPFAIIISTAVCAFAWRDYGYAGLAFTPAGPIVTIVFVTLRLRFGERGARRRQFVVQGGVIRRTNGGGELSPLYVAGDSGYYCTGPATGYSLYGLQLWSADGILARNAYLSEAEKDRELQALLQQAGLKRLSLVFVAPRRSGGFVTHTLSRAWAHLILARGSQMPAQELAWWELFVQPRFRQDTIVELDAALLAQRIESFAATWLGEIAESRELARDLGQLQALIQTASGNVRAMSEERLRSFIQEHSDSVFHFGVDLPGGSPDVESGAASP